LSNQSLTQELSKTSAALARADAMLSAEVVERTRAESELTQRSQELDDVRYVTAHDMKEPVRGLLNYASFLSEDYGEKLGESGLAKLDAVRRLSRRLDHITDWLLHGSSAGKREAAMAETDLDKLVAEVVDAMRGKLNERGVEIRIPHLLPRVRCNREQVAEVFRALITNAMTYNDKAGKWIEIGVTDSRTLGADAPVGLKQSASIFSVRDNGPGIAAKDLATIFQIFKRPHGIDQYDGGTGVGLAMANRIIDRHGGRIWAESSSQQGTTILFTLQSG
jgi:light-regulated signal transduction histidine kinase (bacteriophytochrome)